jgi:DNA-binding transcriptional LysR family regulator
VGEIADSRLVALRIGEQQLRVYGAPAYFAGRKPPRTLGELEHHDCIVFRNPSSGRERPWEFHHLGRRLTLQPKARYVVDEGEGLVSAAAAGLGLIQVPDYMAAVALRDCRLKETLAQFRPAPMPISLVYASRLHVPVRLRVLIDALCRRTGGSGR